MSKRRVLLMCAAASAGVLALVVIVFLLLPPTASPPPMPDPNGFSTLLTAGARLSDDLSTYQNVTDEQLQSLLNRNAEAIALARSAFTQETRVPLRFTQEYMTSHLQDLSRIKQIAHAFAAEGHLAQREGRVADGARSYMDVVRTGIECTRGGVLLDAIFGTSLEAIGIRHLNSLQPAMDLETSRLVLAELKSLDTSRPEWEEILKQEKLFVRSAFPIHYQIVGMFMSAPKKAREQMEDKRLKHLNQVRALMLSIAARAYELEHGKPPASAGDLVPGYFDAIPRDAVTGSNLSLATAP